MVVLLLILEEPTYYFFFSTVAVAVCILTRVHKNSLFPSSFPTFVVLVFLILVLLTGLGLYLIVVFICISLIISNIGHVLCFCLCFCIFKRDLMSGWGREGRKEWWGEGEQRERDSSGLHNQLEINTVLDLMTPILLAEPKSRVISQLTEPSRFPNSVEHLFLFLLAICVSYMEKMSVHILFLLLIFTFCVSGKYLNPNF